MKKLFFLLLCSLSLAISCNKDDDTTNDTDIPLELPSATQTGENTFGCLIDGKLWVAEIDSRSFSIITNKITSNYDEVGVGGVDIFYFTLSAQYLLATESSTALTFTDSINDIFSFSLRPIYAKGEIIFDELVTKDIYYVTDKINSSNSEYYLIDTFYNNYINITTLDTTKNIISGLFDLRLVREASMDTLYITEGRFDVKYNPD
jgi:hypothetical protein